ncbi:MAG: M56 family metallopeptidase [Acidobacteriota bacterium]
MMEALLDLARDVVLANAVGAAALALAAAIAERFLPHRPGLVHGLWLLVLLRLLMPPLWTPEIAVPLATGVEESAAGSGELAAALPSLISAPMASLDAACIVDAASVVDAAGSIDAAGVVERALRSAVVAWLAVSAGLLLMAAAAALRIRRLAIGARPVGESLARHWNDLAARLDVRSAPPIAFIEERTSPMLVSILGWSRVLVPAGLWTRLSERERDSLLLHELAHFKRRDHWVRHVELLTLCLFWWHPAAWWASRRLRRAEERACDALVAQTIPEHRRAYADGLLATLKYLSGRRSAASSSTLVLASGIRVADDLKGRIEMIFNPNRPTALPASVRLCLGAAVLIALVFSPALTTPEVTAAEDHSALLQLDGETELIEPLRKIAEFTGLNIVIEPGVDVSKPVRMELDFVPWDAALAGLLEVHDLEFTLIGNVVSIHHPKPKIYATHLYTGEPIDLNLEQADVRQVLTDLAILGDLDLVLDDNVQGTVDLALKAVPWDQALDLVLTVSSLGMQVEDGVLRVIDAC